MDHGAVRMDNPVRKLEMRVAGVQESAEVVVHRLPVVRVHERIVRVERVFK